MNYVNIINISWQGFTVVTTSVGTQVMVPIRLFIPPPGFVLIHKNGIRAKTNLASRFPNQFNLVCVANGENQPD